MNVNDNMLLCSCEAIMRISMVILQKYDLYSTTGVTCIGSSSPLDTCVPQEDHLDDGFPQCIVNNYYN